MLAAHKLGMTKGDWAFLDVELVQVNKMHANNNMYLIKTISVENHKKNVIQDLPEKMKS